MFSSIDANGDGIVAQDDGDGLLSEDGLLVGTINYLTGAYAIIFANPPGVGEDVCAQVYAYQAARPDAILYFDNKFIVRPIPDKPYRVDVEVYKRPTELLDSAQNPDLEQWWQYIAYGAAKKVFEDRSDMESIQIIMPGFKEQELLVLRRTIVQQTKERVATIYSEQSDYDGGNNWGQR